MKTFRKSPYSPFVPGCKLVRVLPRGGRRYVVVDADRYNAVPRAPVIPGRVVPPVENGQELTLWL